MPMQSPAGTNFEGHCTEAGEDYSTFELSAIIQYNLSRSQTANMDNAQQQSSGLHGHTVDRTSQAATAQSNTFSTSSNLYSAHRTQQISREADHAPHEWLCIDPLLLSTPMSHRSHIPMQANVPSATESSTPSTMSPAVAALTGSVRHPHHRSISSNDCLLSSTGTLRTTFACPICYKTFSYPKDLRRHAITHDPSPQRPFQCPISGCEYGTKGFSRRDVLIRHAKGVHGLQSI